MTDPRERFSSRALDYARSRPGYPKAIVELLAVHHGLTKDAVVADVGAGTGLFSQLFLDAGNVVLGVEPNKEMREAGARILAGSHGYRSVDGSAEATSLPDASVDVVASGQAFHWFNRARAHAEFARILRATSKVRGLVVLAWNEPKDDGGPFLGAYAELLRTFGTDYSKVMETRRDDARIAAFFDGGSLTRYVLPNAQRFDREGLRGRLLSSSFTPEKGDARYEPMLAELDAIFAAHRQPADGCVSFEYDTRVFVGTLS